MSEDNKKMKLFIWPEIARDYACGMAAALAPDLESAINAIDAGNSSYSYIRKELQTTAPIVIELDTDQIHGWFSYGGD